MRSIFLILTIVVLSQATRKIPLRIYQLKSNLDTQLDDTDDEPKPLSFKDSALVIDVVIEGNQYSVALDTLSNQLWLPSTDCKSSFCARVKNPIKVTTKDKQVFGYNGLIHGYTVKAKLEIDGSDTDVDLVAADFVDADLAKRLPPGVDGVLGLMNTNVFTPEILGMNPFVSLYINKWRPKESGLYLGDMPSKVTKRDPNSFRPQEISSESSSYWKTSLDYISSSDGPWNIWSKGGADVVLDSTYSGIAGPAGEVDSINKYLGTDDDGYIDCYKIQYLRPLTFHIKGTSFNLDPKNYIRKGKKNYDLRCKSVFEAHSSTRNIWKLGVAFMKQYLVVITYDPKLVTSFYALN